MELYNSHGATINVVIDAFGYFTRQLPTSVAVSESPTSVTYGHESASVFYVTVTAQYGQVVPNGETVPVLLLRRCVFARDSEARYQLGAAPLAHLLSARQQFQDARVQYLRARAARLADTAALFDSMGEPPPDRAALRHSGSGIPPG